MLYIIASMDVNLVTSETHQDVKRNCFDLNYLKNLPLDFSFTLKFCSVEHKHLH